MTTCFCPRCGCETDCLSIGRAAIVAGIRRAVVERWLDNGVAHLLAVRGRRQVCAASLLRPLAACVGPTHGRLMWLEVVRRSQARD